MRWQILQYSSNPTWGGRCLLLPHLWVSKAWCLRSARPYPWWLHVFSTPESSCFRKEEIWSWQAGRLVNSWEHVGGVFKCTFLQTQGISRLSYLWARIFSNIALLATSYQNGLKYSFLLGLHQSTPHKKKKQNTVPPNKAPTAWAGQL